MHHAHHTQARWARALVTARSERGWTQQQVAAHLDVSPATVSRWERGIHRPYTYHIHALCALFGAPREQLGFEAEPAASQQDQVPRPPADAHIVLEHLGLACCLQGWIASLRGQHEQAEHYLLLAADAFARCQSPFAHSIQELRGTLALRAKPSGDSHA